MEQYAMDVNANNIEATFDVETVELSSEFDIEQQNFDALFEINGNTQIRGEGTIDVNYINGVAVITSKTYIYEQAIASDTWVINHNLHKQPQIYIVDSSGNVQIPDEIDVNDENTITVKFIAPFTGKAYLN
jgi:hypothetical protein